MNKLLELIDKRIAAKLNQTVFLTATPAVVQAVNSESNVTVKIIATGSNILIPNYSGSTVRVGEPVQVYYSGNSLTSKNAFIGASLNKSEGGGVQSETIAIIWAGSQAEYDEMEGHSDNTLYITMEDSSALTRNELGMVRGTTVQSDSIAVIWSGTQAGYDDMESHEDDTLYITKEEE